MRFIAPVFPGRVLCVMVSAGAVLILVCFTGIQQAIADWNPGETDDKQSTVISPAAGPGQPASQSPEEMKQARKTCLVNLRLFGRAIHRLKVAAHSLYGEVTKQEYILSAAPDIAAGTTIGFPISYPTGKLMQPRKKWVDHDMGEISQLIKLLKSDLDSLQVPGDEQGLTWPDTGEMQGIMKKVESHYETLASLTTDKTKYDNKAIAKQLGAIEDEMKKMDQYRKKTFHLVKAKDPL